MIAIGIVFVVAAGNSAINAVYHYNIISHVSFMFIRKTLALPLLGKLSQSQQVQLRTLLPRILTLGMLLIS